MALRLLTNNIIRPYSPVIRNAATLAALRGYATKHYTKEHEWISVENDIGTIGITDHAQKQLGDVVFVEVNPVGEKTDQGGQIGAVESVKAASDIYSPVTGEIVDANQALIDDPTLINTSPEDEGWLAKIKISNPDELEGLMDESAYATFAAEEEH
ncbi:glycine cleavage system H protein [Cunninghamella echinulata]|nr:glycine cleavage system H protein [Cunninghamella echinulata]